MHAEAVYIILSVEPRVFISVVDNLFIPYLFNNVVNRFIALTIIIYDIIYLSVCVCSLYKSEKKFCLSVFDTDYKPILLVTCI